MEEQPEPSASNCPYCGGAPEHNPNHVLSATGYTHDDIRFTCSECNEKWTCGVPIGEHDGALAEDLFCESCEKRYGLPHRIREKTGEEVEIHMKCPNEECYFFWKFTRPKDDSGVMLFGYPQITGAIEDADQEVSELGYTKEQLED